VTRKFYVDIFSQKKSNKVYKEQVTGEIQQRKELTADNGHVAAMTEKLLSNSQKVSVLTVIVCVPVFGEQTHSFLLLIMYVVVHVDGARLCL
jgi:hypothetical protein